jgi:hypothetical protein
MAVAVRVICLIGRTPRRITHQVTRPRMTKIASVAMTSTVTRRSTAASTSSSGRPTTTSFPDSRSVLAMRR